MMDRVSPSGVREIMRYYGLYPKKRWGQNFLVDRNVLKKITDACDVGPGQYVFEIGPGLGSLTEELAQHSNGVLAVEIDNSLGPVLKHLALGNDKIRVIFEDIQKIDIESEIQKAFNLTNSPSYRVCANIPYNITTPIIFKLLEQCPHMQSATLMLQKEVGVRLMASPGSKDYGRLTIMVGYYAEVEHLMDVSRNCYYPRPEVDSVVLKLTPWEHKRFRLIDEDVFRNFVSMGFQKRRKTILNITSEFFNLGKEVSRIKIKDVGLDPHLRPENLDLRNIIDLVNTFLEDEKTNLNE